MAEVVGVVFRGGGKVYHFDPAGLELARGDRVVVQTSSGPEIGQVVEPSHAVDDGDIQAQLKRVARVATDKDLESLAANAALRREAMAKCRELIAAHGLDMKLVDAELGFGGEKITFSFTSEERVDFRTLVADLAKELKVRIELRQVGAREEARMVGGLGPCGRSLCCTLFPGDDEPVSIRMAKEQNLPLNPVKISGLCGRLMCCLKYEQEQYVRFRKEAPPKGTPVCCPSGCGAVAGYSMTKDSLTVRLDEGGFTEVKLRTCERQEDGGLLVTPEEVPLAAPSWLESPASLERLAALERSIETRQAEEAEARPGEDGGSADAAAERARRGRGRRGRGRRRGAGRSQGQGTEGESGVAGAAGAYGAGEGPGGEAGHRGGGQGDGRGGGRSRGRRQDGPTGQRPDQRQGAGEGASQAGGGAGGSAGPARSDEQNGGSDGGAGGGSRNRRRRRPRRPGGEGGAAGGSAGGPGSGSGYGGGSGGGGANSGG